MVLENMQESFYFQVVEQETVLSITRPLANMQTIAKWFDYYLVKLLILLSKLLFPE